MALTDVAGVLSRKFVVGFFIPTFFGCLALKLLVSDKALPDQLQGAVDGKQILILGGVALLLGLFLWGVHYSLIRLLEGYWLVAATLPNRTGPRGDPDSLWNRARLFRGVRWIITWPFRLASGLRLKFGNWKRGRWVRTRAELERIRWQKEESDARTRAGRELTERFPAEDLLVLPTELGNVIRAFETHPRMRYGLDGIMWWPRIETMLNDSERATIDETTTDFAFWLNSLAVVVLGGALLLAERLWHPPGGVIETVLVEATIVATLALGGTWMYRQAIGAAARWGLAVRAAFDVHRFEVYDRLGVRRPYTAEDDGESGRAVNRLFAFAIPLPPESRVGDGAKNARSAKRRKRIRAMVCSAAGMVIGFTIAGVTRGRRRTA
jgi:hypothetical protein